MALRKKAARQREVVVSAVERVMLTADLVARLEVLHSILKSWREASSSACSEGMATHGLPTPRLLLPE
eukprot:CAMPEP_0172890092 /NCGR_PEP_ID=MMETSP1075-20121228/140364_1 /TAXON_ID=2916 /ORGANISM="Ceratium fusus, Strain PA161109" /LENGTH=67 /DNA_ID=CAMNT_0013744283 /DNA_START=14 /DNA_END=214 /DNA_ORIENTATION=-